MAKNKTPKAVADMQPDELTELKKIVLEFVHKIEAIDEEVAQLKDDRKEVIEEYQDKLDIKTLNTALRVIKLQNSVDHKDTFDAFMDVLVDPAQ